MGESRDRTMEIDKNHELLKGFWNGTVYLTRRDFVLRELYANAETMYKEMLVPTAIVLIHGKKSVA